MKIPKAEVRTLNNFIKEKLDRAPEALKKLFSKPETNELVKSLNRAQEVNNQLLEQEEVAQLLAPAREFLEELKSTRSTALMGKTENGELNGSELRKDFKLETTDGKTFRGKKTFSVSPESGMVYFSVSIKSPDRADNSGASSVRPAYRPHGNSDKEGSFLFSYASPIYGSSSLDGIRKIDRTRKLDLSPELKQELDAFLGEELRPFINRIRQKLRIEKSAAKQESQSQGASSRRLYGIL